MMRLLILDVSNDCRKLGMSIGERAESFLPGKPAQEPLLLVDVVGRAGLDRVRVTIPVM